MFYVFPMFFYRTNKGSLSLSPIEISIFNFAKLVTIFGLLFAIAAVRRYANLVDLEKCYKMTTGIFKYIVAKVGFDTAENNSLNACQKIDRYIEFDQT